MVQVLKHCPALQNWLLNVALPDEYEVNPAHAYFVVCLFAVYLTEPVFAVKQTCSPLQADLLTWMTPRSVSSAALLHAVVLFCSQLIGTNSGCIVSSACFALKLLQQYPAKSASARNCQSTACLCVPTASLCANLPLYCRSSGQTGME